MSFFALLTLMLLTCDSVLISMSLTSSFLHESGHILAMVLCHDKINALKITATGLRIDKISSVNLSYNQEIFIALSGVGMNFILCGVSALIYFACSSKNVLSFLCINIIVAIFNLMPIESLDGAKALHFLLLKKISHEKACELIAVISVITIILMIIFAGVSFYLTKTNFSLLIVIIYLIILLINRIFQLKKNDL